jgi:hypothetical protein
MENAVPNDEMQNDLRARWQSQPAESGQMSIEGIRIDAQRFEKRIHRRNVREYCSALFTIAILAGEIWWLKPVMPIRVGLWLCIAGVVVFLYQLRKRGSIRALPADLALTSCVEFHRRELEHQRDGLQSVWLWGIMPMVPGILVIVVGLSFAPHGWIMAPIVAVFMASVFLFFVKLNQRAALRLQRKIDELSG